MMTPLAARPKADKQIQIRVQQQVRDLIDEAAAASGQSRSEFMIESSKARAIDVLLDRRVFRLSDEQAEAVAAALSRPPRPNAALKALMRDPAPWE